MVILTEQDRTLEFLQSEANGHRSRDTQEFDSTTDWAGARILPGQVYAIVGGVAVPWDGDAVDGSETAAGILAYGVDAGQTQTRTVITRDAEAKRYKLTYDGTDAELDAALLALGILVRD
jgi:hypothetical protein